MTLHRYSPRVIRTDDGFHAIAACSCGWVGDIGGGHDQWKQHKHDDN